MNDYSNNYSTTSYGAQGGAQGGGFMPGSQTGDSPNAKRSYGKDTLRPVTIKQLLDAHHPHPDAEYFMVDGSEATQVTFVGQVRNISTQTTNVTYKLDDGTGIIEVKVWIDADAFNDEADPSNQKPKPVEQGYARVWGRLKAFNNKRHVGANIIRPIQDFNEIQYHLLEATAVHLHFSRGPVEQLQQSNGGAQSNGAQNGAYGGGMQQGGGGKQLPAGTSMAARKVFQAIKTTEQGNEGLHIQHIATAAGLDINEVVKGGGELMDMGMIFTTVDESTWALLEIDG
ncbi:Replication factor A protein 2 [Elasticomyces elasticus]|nr:Replication factor A protein 2 [Elasticomyces elasticus]KAK4970693.1 Replication factor A protein 2 [Elasticomyces elasticus]KAK5746016.1 Replication factor A protein 2 [Elasticomyces elasticus]